MFQNCHTKMQRIKHPGPKIHMYLLKKFTAVRSLSSVAQNFQVVPDTRFNTKGDTTFQSAAPRLWKSTKALQELSVLFEKALIMLFKPTFC